MLGCCLILAAAPGAAQAQVKQVLMLQSLNRGNVTLDQFTGNFRVRLDERSGKPVNVVQVTVEPTGFVGAPERAVVDYIRSMYANRPAPDLVVTAGGPAAVFARKYRRELFPATPLLFAAVDQRFIQAAPLGENEGAVSVRNDFPRLVDDILSVRPETRQIFVVNGSGALGQFWRRELEGGFARFRGRVNFLWSDELSLQDILARVAGLPADSAIVYLTFGTDSQGAAYADEQVLADLHAKANAPMFGAHSPLFGSGIVGGSMLSVSDIARRTADAASRILDGEPPARFRDSPLLPGHPTFDWRELQRWGIPESRLPPGSIVQFRGPSLWGEYRAAILTAAVLLVSQSLLIAWLLLERRARRRAEIDSRRNLALAADADRRGTISALATSIGHELGQPLSSIVHNTKALQRMARSGSALPGATAEILDDIESEAVIATHIIDRHRAMLRSHQLQKRPTDLHGVVYESLALVAHDMSARRIVVTLDRSTGPCVVDGDQVLLQQVLVNLLRNAMDALAEMPPARRRITLRSAVTGADVEVSVSDTGTGVPAEIIGTLFSAFVTTKPHGMGLGLAIALRIVEAHGGTLVAGGNADGGATFTVTLPRSAKASFSAARLSGATAA